MPPTAMRITCEQCNLCTRRPQSAGVSFTRAPQSRRRPCGFTIAGQLSHAPPVPCPTSHARCRLHVPRSHAPPVPCPTSHARCRLHVLRSHAPPVPCPTLHVWVRSCQRLVGVVHDETAGGGDVLVLVVVFEVVDLGQLELGFEAGQCVFVESSMPADS